jgi:uncharacterized OsmC-like protein
VKITLLSDEAIRLDATPGPLTIEAPSVEQSYSPFHMLASSLAVCTHSVLHSWASHAKLPADDLAVEVRWTFAERPHRVGSMDVTLEWPGLPESRREAARRAAKLCTVHATLSTPPTLTTSVAGDAARAAGAGSVAAVPAGSAG